MADDAPRWRRRKTARPGEILEAALAVFAEQGFAAAKLTEIARRAGVSKAALYLYFETKEDLFRAVARTLVAPNLTALADALEASDAPFGELAPALLARAAGLLADQRAIAIARMVIADVSGNFPDLARIWREDVVEQVLALVARLIVRAQASGRGRRRRSAPLRLPSDGAAGDGRPVPRRVRRRRRAGPSGAGGAARACRPRAECSPSNAKERKP